MSVSTQDLLNQLSSGQLTSVALVEQCLSVIDADDETIHSFLSVDRDGALAQAADIDRKRLAGESVGVLQGLPIAVKDNICTKDWPTTCASKMLENFVPPYNAFVVERIRQADGVILGKTNLDEFAMGSSTENSAFGATRNPRNTQYVPGGSSGGSAAAVAAGMAPLSLGSDTGGSIRQPAGFCGIVGMKPTYGRVSRYGLVAFASSLDQIGPFANDVTGAALTLDVIAGHDTQDSTSLDVETPKFVENLDQPLKGLRIGVVEEHLSDAIDSEIVARVREVIDVYKSLGAEIQPVDLPHAKYGVATYYIIAPSEASSNLSRYDGVHYGHRADNFENLEDMYCRTRGEGFGPEVKRRVMLGTYALSSGYYDAYYNKALKVRRLVSEDFAAAFNNVDVILGPVTPHPPFKHGEFSEDPLAMYMADMFTIGANLAGLPGISVPCGTNSNGLPIGFQILGPPLEDLRVLQAARMYERETGDQAKSEGSAT